MLMKDADYRVNGGIVLKESRQHRWGYIYKMIVNLFWMVKCYHIN